LKKNENLGAQSSTLNPAFIDALTYYNPSANVKANYNFESAPAYWIWYPEIEIGLNLGIFLEQ